MPRGVTDDPDRFEEAVEAVRKRVPMSEAEYDRLTEAEREFAFKVSGVAQADVAQRVLDGIRRAVEEGTTLDDFKAEMKGVLDEVDPARLETVFRTNAQTAYNAGRHKVFSAPTVRRARPYLRFDAIMDSRTSSICEELDGKILPADDPFWRRHTPPLHHQCRSILTALSAEEAGEEGVDETPDTDGEVADGFGREPSQAGTDWEPDTSGYDPEIARTLRELTDE